MEPTADILGATRGVRRPGSVTVGFALETGDAMAKGRAKLERKDLDLIVVNDALEPGAGFEVDTNRVALLDREGSARILPLQSKREVAEAILDAVEQHPWPMSGGAILRSRSSSAAPRSSSDAREAMEPGEQMPPTPDRPPPSPDAAPSDRPADAPKWKKGAPPIPGPGLAVTSPAPVLLSNDLASLPTLDAVAERIRTTYCCELCPQSHQRGARARAIPQARLVLVGEGPGATEDATGPSIRGPGGPAPRVDSRRY